MHVHIPILVGHGSRRWVVQDLGAVGGAKLWKKAQLAIYLLEFALVLIFGLLVLVGGHRNALVPGSLIL